MPRPKWLNNSYWNVLIKLAVVVVLAAVLYRQVFGGVAAADMWRAFRASLVEQDAWWLWLAVALMPLNWGLEALKWRRLTRSFLQISWWRTCQAILAGVSVSVVTPNRMGEYVGRILLVEPQHNWRAIIATMVGSFCQLLVLLAFGCIGLYGFSWAYLELETAVARGIGALGLALVFLMAFCFYNVGLVVQLVRRLPAWRWREWAIKQLTVLEHYDAWALSEALCYAILRYGVYSLQYYLLLRFFGIDVPLVTGLAGIATMFLLQASVPLPPLMGLLARGELALYIWGFFSDNELNILAAAFGLWILNVVLPALVGTVFIVNVNVLKSLGYGRERK